MRVALIGQAPGANTDPQAPLWPTPKLSGGGRLFALTGLSEEDYISRFERYNLLNHFPGRTARDDRFPRRDARIAAQAMLPLLRGATLVLVGRNVATAFGVDQEFFEWHRWSSDNVVAVIPHTSGRNHWYNKRENRDRTRAFFAELIERDCKVL